VELCEESLAGAHLARAPKCQPATTQLTPTTTVYAGAMSLRFTLLSAVLGSALMLAGCEVPGAVVEAPAPPAADSSGLLGDTPGGVTMNPAFAEACETWDTQGLEWRELTGVTTATVFDEDGLAVTVTGASLPIGPASRYNAAIEVCPGFLWVISHEGTSHYVALGDSVWALGPTLATSGETGTIPVRGVTSGGPVWGFRDSVAVGNHVYLSDAVIDVSKQCVRIDVHRVETKDLLAYNPNTSVIYASDPCVSYLDDWRSVAPLKTHFGGALAFSEELNELYVTIGDFHLGASSISQADAVGSVGLAADYAILLDDTAAVSVVVAMKAPATTADSRIFATGLRNSLGLAFSGEGDLWLSDHGPSGGDEINIIVEGADYGWPLYSAGKPYDRGQWPRDSASLPEPWLDFTDHDNPLVSKPVLTWTPAVAPSELVLYQPTETLFSEYRGDMLMGTLRGQALHRLSRDASGGFTETRLPLGERIRDLTVMSQGQIVALTDSSRLLVLTRGE
jgi:hypothetical protein